MKIRLLILSALSCLLSTPFEGAPLPVAPGDFTPQPLVEKTADGFRVPQPGHWLLLVEDEQQSWRLLGKVFLPTDTEIVLSALQ